MDDAPIADLGEGSSGSFWDSTCSIRILHVDDNPTFVELAAELLEREATTFEVVGETSVREGIRRFRSSRIDCVVSDYEMPEADGLEFLRLVRNEDPSVPFILFTGKGSESIASEAISEGVTDYLQKSAGTEQYTMLAKRIENAVDRHRAERRLAQQTHLFEQAQQLASVGGWEFDPETNVVRWTSGVQRIHGVPSDYQPSLDEAIEFYHPDDRPVIEAAIERALDDGEPFDLQCRIATRAGQLRWVRARGDAELVDGAVDYVRGTIQDITEQIERERELTRYKRLVENLPVGVFRTTPDGEYIDGNPAFVELFDAESKAELFANPPEAYYADPADREELLQTLRRKGTAKERAVELETMSGDRLWGSITETLTVEDGTEYIDGIIQDITDRRNSRSDLEQKTRAMDEAPIGIVLTDLEQEDNPIVYANEGFERLTGYDETEALGRNCRFLQGEETAPEPVAAMRDAIDARQPTVVELRNYRADGTSFWNRVTIAPLTNDDGSVRRYLGFQQDVTDRVERERELQRQNERLDRFTRVLSHDLRTPLTTATGRLEMVREASSLPDAQQDLEEVADALERMNSFIETLLSTTRIGVDTSSTSPVVALDEIVRECWNAVDPVCATLDTDLDAYVRADEGQLVQLFTNLFQNALDHAGSDVTVRVGRLTDGTGDRSADDGNTEQTSERDGFYVEDDGPGVPPDEPIFEPGYSTAADGIGYGLRIVTDVADAHGWSVEATSGTDGGARFEITGVQFVA